jgi:hypothetical protein
MASPATDPIWLIEEEITEYRLLSKDMLVATIVDPTGLEAASKSINPCP